MRKKQQQEEAPAPEPKKPTLRVSNYVTLELECEGYRYGGGSYYHQTATVEDLDSFMTTVDREFKGENVAISIREGVLTAKRSENLDL